MQARHFFLATSLAMIASFACAAGTATSIDKVPGKLTTPEGRAVFDRQIRGTPQPDGFGTQLPEGFSTASLVHQLVPEADPNALILAGAKPWPGNPDKYVAMVCMAESPEDASRRRRYWADECRTESGTAWFGVFERHAGGDARLLARTQEPVTVPTNWSGSNLDSPEDLSDAGLPSTWLRFDPAPYHLNDSHATFGVRAGWSEGYSGGGASFEALYLFMQDGQALHVVFAAPMMYMKMIAGDWNKDGTRNRDVYDGSNVLVISGRATAGFKDIQLRERNGKWRKTYRWSEKDGAYTPN